jgi:hypothetical protein
MPRDLERIINRCLRKNPDRRFQHMVDLEVALEEMKEESESGRSAAPATIAVRRRAWLWGAIALALCIGISLTVWLLSRSGQRSEPLAPVPLTSYPGHEDSPSFSPDGNQVAFVWNGPEQNNSDIWVKLIGTEVMVQCTTTR